jgi:hypothetical protein
MNLFGSLYSTHYHYARLRRKHNMNTINCKHKACSRFHSSLGTGTREDRHHREYHRSHHKPLRLQRLCNLHSTHWIHHCKSANHNCCKELRSLPLCTDNRIDQCESTPPRHYSGHSRPSCRNETDCPHATSFRTPRRSQSSPVN